MQKGQGLHIQNWGGATKQVVYGGDHLLLIRIEELMDFSLKRTL